MLTNNYECLSVQYVSNQALFVRKIPAALKTAIIWDYQILKGLVSRETMFFCDSQKPTLILITVIIPIQFIMQVSQVESNL